MKRKFIVLDDDESDQEGIRPFLEKNLSRSPPRRIASLCLSDSSRTVTPEPLRASNICSSNNDSQLEDIATGTNYMLLREARNDVFASSPLPQPRARTRSSAIPLNKTAPKSMGQKKPANEYEIIDLDEEITEIRPINLDDGKVIDVEELEQELANDIFEMQDPDGPNIARLGSWTRNAPIRAPLKKLDITKSRRGEYILPGYTVELRDGRFLEITTILENTETEVVSLRGCELKRTKELGGELKFDLNKVCYIFDVDLDDSRPMREQSAIEIEANRVKKIRKLTRTNYHFPAYRFKKEDLPGVSHEERQRHVEANEDLVVRWQYITTFRTGKDRDQQAKYSANFLSRKFLRLDENECDKDDHLPLYALRYQWRGNQLYGDEKRVEDTPTHVHTRADGYTDVVCIDDSDEEITVEKKELNSTTRPVLIHVASSDFLNVDPWTFMGNIRRRFDTEVKLATKDIRKTTTTSKPSTYATGTRNLKQKKTSKSITGRQQYSYADAFCGAGGATRGAVMAGLSVIWGLDFNSNAAQTWRHNFPQGQLFEKWANEVCSMPDPEGKLIVDVLHLSPPCQVWSPAHTIAGKDDDMNFASLYAVQELIAKAKPRMVTLEQTFGIVHERFRRPFNSLIRMFTDHNFSVSWQILELERLGLPQRRKRLIIVAAAPGETLPPIPQYAYSRDGRNGTKQFRSARSVLSSIPPNAANHDVPVHPQGGANGRGHPSGRRGLTCREVAGLQTFPHDHVFKGQGIRKQIGNAVPPLVAKLVFSEVIKHLEKVDAEEKRMLGG